MWFNTEGNKFSKFSYCSSDPTIHIANSGSPVVKLYPNNDEHESTGDEVVHEDLKKQPDHTYNSQPNRFGCLLLRTANPIGLESIDFMRGKERTKTAKAKIIRTTRIEKAKNCPPMFEKCFHKPTLNEAPKQ